MFKQIRRWARVGGVALAGFVLLMWAWSYVEADEFSLMGWKSELNIVSVQGTVLVRHAIGFVGRGPPAFHWSADQKGGRRYEYLRYAPTWLQRRGFRLELYHTLVSGRMAAPHWFVALVLILIAASGRIQRTLLKRLPAVPRTVRPRLLRTSRLFAIAIITAVVAVPIVTLGARFNLRELRDALVNTPMMCGIFLIIPLVGIWLVRKPLRVQRDRLMIHRDRYLCTACGYNLTKNTTGICPECGAESMRLMKKHEGEQ